MDLPPGLVFCIGLTDPERQLELVRHFKAEGRRVACGTYGGAVREAPDVVREIFAAADVFFCNRSEAIHLFGDLDAARTTPGKLLFVTLSAAGARVIQGRHLSDVPAVKAEELDPTGAGDTFCGTVLADLSSGAHPVQAARHGVAAAAEMVTAVGPAALLRPASTESGPVGLRKEEGRVRVVDSKIRTIAGVVGSLPEVTPFPFIGGSFPPAGHPATLDFFFAATLQQFGFWTAHQGRYERPYVGAIGDRQLKGSDFLWAAYRRWLDDDACGLSPDGHRRLTAETLEHRLRADDGDPLPVLGLRLEQARGYGRDLCALGWSPAAIVAEANRARRPLATFLSLLDRIGGYKEDPLRKKSALLALILRQRPEGFLRVAEDEDVPPVVDYHVQRSCLRMGLVRVDDGALSRRLAARSLLEDEDERVVRGACYQAMARLQEPSGRTMGAVDWFFFQNRRRCPEMTEPDCASCPVDEVCAHRTKLFQPVRRTSFY